MRHGNCLIGMIVLALRHRLAGRPVVLWRPDQVMPHFQWRVGGRIYHYRVVRDVLPRPLHYF